MISIHDRTALAALRQRYRLDPTHMRRMLTLFCKKQRTASESLEALPAEVRNTVAGEIQFHALALDQRHDSQIDGATKLLFRSAAGLLLESVVLRAASGRTSLCVSTQVGCAAHCDFCATGKMGIARNLTVDEILDQWVQANQLLRPEGRTIRNLVFMGMGEPFHNEQQLHAALDVLTDRACFSHPLQRVLVSSVGIPDGMIRLAERYPLVRQALSLHAANQEQRVQLIPLAARHPLPELHATLLRLNQLQSQPVLIEYLLLANRNDTADDARRLIDFLRGLHVLVNLIPYNPIDSAPHLVGSDTPQRQAFAGWLKSAGLRVTTRYSLGSDIAAACGQLVRQENRRLSISK